MIKLPKWIDDAKGKDPFVDDLIVYIENECVNKVMYDYCMSDLKATETLHNHMYALAEVASWRKVMLNTMYGRSAPYVLCDACETPGYCSKFPCMRDTKHGNQT